MTLQPIRTTQLVFNNMAIYIIPPHMPFQTNTIITLTIDFGNGSITTATYQTTGDNMTDTTCYMQGGGGISLPFSSNILTGASKLIGNIHYASEPQELLSQYNGPLIISENNNKANLTCELYATGQGPLEGKRLYAKLSGIGDISIACGIKTINFPNSSIKLAITY